MNSASHNATARRRCIPPTAARSTPGILTDFPPHGNESVIPGRGLTRAAFDFGKYRRHRISLLVVRVDERSGLLTLTTSGKTRRQRVSLNASTVPQSEAAFPVNGEVCRSLGFHTDSPQNSQSEEA